MSYILISRTKTLYIFIPRIFSKINLIEENVYTFDQLLVYLHNFFYSYLCGVETDGFRNSVNHVRQVHPQALTRDKNAPCIVCPKLFARMDHLKKHVWSHVNKISPGIPPHFVGPSGGGHVGGASDSNRTRPKMEKLPLLIDTTVTTPTDPALYGQLRFKMDPETFPDGVDWSTQTYFNW